MPSPRPVLWIGNRNYSSWSLRAWLALRFMGLEFDLERLSLDTPEFERRIRALPVAGRVPALQIDGHWVWDSLAICDFVAESASRGGWPQDPGLRAHARSAVAEMHSGFPALRSAMPMNIRARRRIDAGPEAGREVERMIGLWCEALSLHDGAGGWLYGERGIADAFFAPVVLRFLTYGVPMPELCRPWLDRLLEDPELTAWCDAALAETEVVEADEAGTPV
jgi:glutathione S-transferase